MKTVRCAGLGLLGRRALADQVAISPLRAEALARDVSKARATTCCVIGPSPRERVCYQGGKRVTTRGQKKTFRSLQRG